MLANIKKLNQYQISLIICFVFFVLMHLLTFAIYGDDAYYCNILGKTPLWQWLVWRYYNWSSRLFIDAITVIVAANFGVWQLLDILMWMILYINLHYLCFGKNRSSKSYLLLLLIMAYPFAHMGSSGWIATTVNYLWPISILLYPLNALVHVYREDLEVIHWYQYVLYIVAIFFGCSNELGAFISFSCFVTLWIVMMKKNKKISKWCFISAILISAANLIFIFTCPGNATRMIIEVENFMPEFEQLSLVRIIVLNYIAIFEHFVSKPSALFFLICGIILAGTIKNTKHLWKRFIAAIPIIMDIFFTLYYFILQHIVKIKSADYAAPATINLSQYEFTEQIVLFIVFTVVIVAFVAASYWALEDMAIFSITMFLLILGFCSRMAVGLSPTMFASGNRVYFFFYVAIIISIVLLIERLQLMEIIFYRNLIYLCCVGGIILNIYWVLRVAMFYSYAFNRPT